MPLLALMDPDFLALCAHDMREDQSHREAMSILDPNPLTMRARNDIHLLKVKQMEYLSKMVGGIHEMAKLNANLRESEAVADQLKNLF